MDTSFIKSAVVVTKLIQQTVTKTALLPSEVTAPPDQPVIPLSLFAKTPGYIPKIVHQINACYSVTAYDGCAVMIRRLMEVLIIDAFEKHQIGHKIKDANGDYFMLKELVKRAQNEQTFGNLSRIKKRLEDLKEVGDQSAHSRFYNAQRSYIDDLRIDLRTVAERLLYLAGYR
jgi:hypothetical protein